MATNDPNDSHTEILTSFLELAYFNGLIDRKVLKLMKECDDQGPAEGFEHLKVKVEALKKEQERLKKRSRDFLIRFCQSNDKTKADFGNYETNVQLGMVLYASLGAKSEDELEIFAAGMKLLAREGEEMDKKADQLTTEIDQLKNGSEIHGSKNVASGSTAGHGESVDPESLLEVDAKKSETNQSSDSRSLEDMPRSPNNVAENREGSDGHQSMAAEEPENQENAPTPLLELQRLNGCVRTLNWLHVTQAKQKFEVMKLKVYEKLDRDVKPNDSGCWDEERGILDMIKVWVFVLVRNSYYILLNLLSVMLFWEASREDIQEMRFLFRGLADNVTHGAVLPVIVHMLIFLLETPELVQGTLKWNWTMNDAVEERLSYYQLGLRPIMIKTFDSVRILTFLLTASNMPKAESSLDKFVLASMERSLKMVEKDLRGSEVNILKAITTVKELEYAIML